MAGAWGVDAVIFVLGMHRSGTSALTAALERCGAELGDVQRTMSRNQPRGNLEHAEVVALNDALLAAHRARWDQPPSSTLVARPEERAAIGALVDRLGAGGVTLVKDPRLVLTLEPWLDIVPEASIVATFRHPVAVARSLRARDRMSTERALALWTAYNERLVRLHRTLGFPLVEFDLSDRGDYCRRVTAVATELGLAGSASSVGAVIEAETRTQPADVPSLCRPAFAELRRMVWTPPVDAEHALVEVRGPVIVEPAADVRVRRVATRLPRWLGVTVWRTWHVAQRARRRLRRRGQ